MSSGSYYDPIANLRVLEQLERMRLLAQSHLLVGIVFFILFLLTGVYMALNFPELYSGREEVRMMFRSTHIYLLMSALINLMTGNYLLHAKQTSYSMLTKLASLLIVITPVLFFAAFFIEPQGYAIERPVSFWGVVFLVAGVLLHALLNVKAAFVHD